MNQAESLPLSPARTMQLPGFNSLTFLNQHFAFTK